jgi:TolB-like protein
LGPSIGRSARLGSGDPRWPVNAISLRFSRAKQRTSSFYFKGQHATIAEIAKALGVSHVLEGSVRRAGNTIRVTAQLVRADNGYHL